MRTDAPIITLVRIDGTPREIQLSRRLPALREVSDADTELWRMSQTAPREGVAEGHRVAYTIDVGPNCYRGVITLHRMQDPLATPASLAAQVIHDHGVFLG